VSLDAEILAELRAIRQLLEAQAKPKSAPKAPPCTAEDADAFVAMWNANCGGLPKAETAGPADGPRRAGIAACLKVTRDLTRWADAVKALAASPHHRGQNERGWVANIDFLIGPSQRLKWMEEGARRAAQAPKATPHREVWCGCGKQAIHGPGTRNPDTAAEPQCADCWA
jgi:hypothetical protein